MVGADGASDDPALDRRRRQLAHQLSGSAVDLNGIWGASAGDIDAVGDSGTILHRP